MLYRMVFGVSFLDEEIKTNQNDAAAIESTLVGYGLPNKILQIAERFLMSIHNSIAQMRFLYSGVMRVEERLKSVMLDMDKAFFMPFSLGEHKRNLKYAGIIKVFNFYCPLYTTYYLKNKHNHCILKAIMNVYYVGRRFKKFRNVTLQNYKSIGHWSENCDPIRFYCEFYSDLHLIRWKLVHLWIPLGAFASYLHLQFMLINFKFYNVSFQNFVNRLCVVNFTGTFRHVFKQTHSSAHR